MKNHEFKKKTCNSMSSRVVFRNHISATPLDIEYELKLLNKATKKICASKESAREFLVNSGFLTEDGQLAERYR